MRIQLFLELSEYLFTCHAVWTKLSLVHGHLNMGDMVNSFKRM